MVCVSLGLGKIQENIRWDSLPSRHLEARWGESVHDIVGGYLMSSCGVILPSGGWGKGLGEGGLVGQAGFGVTEWRQENGSGGRHVSTEW